MTAVREIRTAYPQVDAELALTIVETAEAIGANYKDLANLIHFESGKTFSSTAKNPHSGATGLIQFMPRTAKNMGTTIEALAALTPVEQMRWVKRYFDLVRRGQWAGPAGLLDNKQRLYLAVFYPIARDWPSDRRFPDDVVANNPGILTPAHYIAHVDRMARLR